MALPRNPSKSEPQPGPPATILERMRNPCCVGLLLALTSTGCGSEVVHSLEQLPSGPERAMLPDLAPCVGRGSALSFDGIGARVIADLNSTGSLPTGNSARTVEMWAYVRPTSWAVNRHTLFEYGTNILHQAWAI